MLLRVVYLVSQTPLASLAERARIDDKPVAEPAIGCEGCLESLPYPRLDENERDGNTIAVIGSLGLAMSLYLA